MPGAACARCWPPAAAAGQRLAVVICFAVLPETDWSREWWKLRAVAGRPGGAARQQSIMQGDVSVHTYTDPAIRCRWDLLSCFR